MPTRADLRCVRPSMCPKVTLLIISSLSLHQLHQAQVFNRSPLNAFWVRANTLQIHTVRRLLSLGALAAAFHRGQVDQSQTHIQ